MLRLALSMALLLALFSCKPLADDNQRSAQDPNNTSESKATNLISEKSFEEWTGRSDLKVGWTFENLP